MKKISSHWEWQKGNPWKSVTQSISYLLSNEFHGPSPLSKIYCRDCAYEESVLKSQDFNPQDSNMTWIWRVKPTKQLTQNQNESNACNHIVQKKKVFDPEAGVADPETGITARWCRRHETPI